MARSKPGTKALHPGFIPPARATRLGIRPPRGSDWIHEIKFDGYRMQLQIMNQTAHVYSRSGHDWTKKCRKIAADAFLVRAKSAIVDGEVVAPAADGTVDFSAVQRAMSARRPSDALVMYAFDLLYLDGQDLRALPLIERKAMLKKLLTGSEIRFSDSFEVDGEKMFERVCAMGLEGVVSKRRLSRYRSGDTQDWIKTTCRLRETLVITGYAVKNGHFDGLYLGRADGGELVNAGRVTDGFNPKDVPSLRKRLDRVALGAVKGQKSGSVVPVKPELLAEIEYRGITSTGKLRHPSFKGLREDL